MGTRYDKGDKVTDETHEGIQEGEVQYVRNPDSDSPTYVIDENGYKYERKASDIHKTGAKEDGGEMEEYYATPYSFVDDVTSPKELVEMFPSLRTLFEGYDKRRAEAMDRLAPLREEGYKALAWTPNVRYVYYHEDKEILVTDIEGDLRVVHHPTDEYLNEVLSEYPMGEVALGEKYDERFDRGK